MSGTIGVKIEAQYEQFEAATGKLGSFFGGVMDGMKAELKAMSDQAKIDMKGHESATVQFANILKSNMMGVEGAVKGVKVAWAQLGVIFGGVAFMKQAVSDTVAMTVSSEKLGRDLGISATQASYLNVAIKKAHGTTEEYVTMVKGMDTQIRRHEDAVKAMGLQTRDANGHLKDQQTLLMDGLDVLRGYKEGTDRNMAAQVLFGKGVEVTSEMLQLNKEKMAEARGEADALGLAVGKDDVEAADKFRTSMEYLHGIIDAVMKAIGSALLPVLNDLAEWFKNYGPQAILAIKVALDIVISLFHGLALAVKVLWELVTLAFNNMVTTAGAFAKVFTALFHGDFAGAKAAAEDAFHGIQANAGAAFKNIVDDATQTGESLKAMWDPLINGSKAVDSGAIGGGSKTIGEKPEKGGKAKKDHSAEDARKAYEEFERLRKEEFDSLMESYKLEETAAHGHWEKILEIQKQELSVAISLYGEGSKQAIDAQNKILETERHMAEEHARLEEIKAEATRKMLFARVGMEEQAAQTREQLGLITTTELLRQEQGFEDARYEIAKKALDDEAAANIDRVIEHEQTLLKLEELDIQHAGRVAEISNQAAIQAAQPMMTVFQTMQQSFATAIAGMINRTMSFRDAIRSVFQSILGALVNMLAQWIARVAANYIRDLLMHKTNAASKAAIDKASTLGTVTRAAAMAGALGTASFAGAPWPVDMGAPAFGAAMAAASLAYGVGASAEGGYDIPAGVNPITQLHQKEMVLPQGQADVIRDMADNGGGGGGGMNVTIHAIDAQGVRDLFMNHGAELAGALKSHLQRNPGSYA